MVRKMFTYEFGNMKELSASDVLRTIDELMIHTLELTEENMHDEVERSVPKDTGVLRATVHTALRTSKYQARRIEINIGPAIYYSKYVDRFTTSQVRHAVDPEAEGQYSSHLIKEGKFRIKLNWDLSKLTIGAR